MARLIGLWFLAMLAPCWLTADEGLDSVSKPDPLWKAFGKPSPSAPIRIRARLIPSAATAASTVTLKVEGSLDPGYYIYSALDVGPDGPGPTLLQIDGAPLIPVAKIRESAPTQSWDAVFSSHLNIHLTTFWIERDFQIAPSTAAGRYDLEGALVYRLCDGRICNVARKINFIVSLTVR